MRDGITRDSLRKHTVAVIGASLEICSSREHVSRSETIVHLGGQTIASSMARLSGVKHTALSRYFQPPSCKISREGLSISLSDSRGSACSPKL